MPPRGPGRLLLAVVLSTSACVAEGQYVIRGTVRAEDPAGSLKPLPGVRVEADGGRGGGSDPVVTSDDGSFALTYRFGGLLLPFLSGNSNPDVIFSAPGFGPRTVRLKANRTEPGISRQGCDRCSLGWGTCCGIDVVLSPAAVPAGGPPGGAITPPLPGTPPLPAST